jgi:hypothetical protein
VANHRGPTVSDQPTQPQPNMEDYATIEAWCAGEPAYSFGYIFYVYGISPDLLPNVAMQAGNTHLVSRFRPNKSWEITYLCGGTPSPTEPKTGWNDGEPLLSRPSDTR